MTSLVQTLRWHGNYYFQGWGGHAPFMVRCCKRIFLYLLLLFMKVINTDFFSIILLSIIKYLCAIFNLFCGWLVTDVWYSLSLALAPDFYRISVLNNSCCVLSRLALNRSVNRGVEIDPVSSQEPHDTLNSVVFAPNSNTLLQSNPTNSHVCTSIVHRY